jgi:hypothetical protein
MNLANGIRVLVSEWEAAVVEQPVVLEAPGPLAVAGSELAARVVRVEGAVRDSSQWEMEQQVV